MRYFSNANDSEILSNLCTNSTRQAIDSQTLRDRHNREYVPWEVKELLRSCGYHVNLLKTVDVYDEGQQANFKFFLIKKALWLASFLSLGSIKAEDRGDTILALGKKTSAITDRYPAFLYV
jgi:hypothetical protein